MSKICKSRGCKWPVNPNEDICEECAINGTPAEQAFHQRTSMIKAPLPAGVTDTPEIRERMQRDLARAENPFPTETSKPPFLPNETMRPTGARTRQPHGFGGVTATDTLLPGSTDKRLTDPVVTQQSLIALRDELNERLKRIPLGHKGAASEVIMKINSCLYSEYPSR